MDVSGFWTGEYAYDSVKGLKVEFKAGLVQTGAILSGDSLLYTSPSPRDRQKSRMPSSA